MNAIPAAVRLGRGRRLTDRVGDFWLHGLTLLAGGAAATVLVLIAWKVIDGSRLAIGRFGAGFLWSTTWDPNKHVFGAADFLFGTAVTSFAALLIATPLSIAIGLYLSELAPRGVRGAVSTLVELLAAVPSVVLGLWGILVLGPFVRDHVEPALHDGLGFLPFFSDANYQISGLLPAILILTIMVVPIVASICRELFLAVPHELEEGAVALGSTRWEMVRGVVLPSARGGIAAAAILGLGRALGEAIAVTQVIGGAAAIHWSFFAPADTIASRLANEYQGASTPLQISALFYLALILLVLGVVANLAAQLIVRRFEYHRVAA